MTANGFGRDTLYTPVPNPLLGPILEEVQDLTELKVTLRALWMLHRKKGPLKAVTISELAGDRSLLRGLGAGGKDPESEVRRGLGLAMGRGIFVACGQEGPTQRILLNTERARSAGADLDQDPGPAPADNSGELPDRSKPNIFVLYEDNIGSLSPILAEELKEAESRYSWQWIREAFQIAASENKRSWRYIAGILRRWAAEGKDERKYAGRYADRHEGGYDGKPGRHTAADQRQKYLEEYQRHRDRLAGKRPGPGAGNRG